MRFVTFPAHNYWRCHRATRLACPLRAGSTHNLTLKYGTTKGGKHAYDFLTTWDWSEDWILDTDRCQDNDGCDAASTESRLDIPQDPNVPVSFEPSAPGDRQFVMRGGSPTSATTPAIASGDYSGNSETSTRLSRFGRCQTTFQP